MTWAVSRGFEPAELDDAARIDSKAGAFGRKSSFRFRKPELVPKKVQEISGVFAVMDREGRI